jgi:hypothetical protein
VSAINEQLAEAGIRLQEENRRLFQKLMAEKEKNNRLEQRLLAMELKLEISRLHRKD